MTTALKTISLPAIGQHWPEQGGVLLGLMPGQNGTPDYALILSGEPSADLVDVPWGEYGQRIEGCSSEHNGLANTLAMVEAGNELAKRITALSINGFTDWYLPSRNELRLAYVAARDQFAHDDWYWSSTQFSPSHAWLQYFGDGYQGSDDKHYQGRARAVRRFLIP
jgi:hypothetical protein